MSPAAKSLLWPGRPKEKLGDWRIFSALALTTCRYAGSRKMGLSPWERGLAGTSVLVSRGGLSHFARNAFWLLVCLAVQKLGPSPETTTVC